MNSIRINYNPLSFSTARAMWSNPNSTFSHRLLKTATSMLYDVYVKNPYDLTIQNTKNLFISSAHLSVRQKIASVVLPILGVFTTFILFGTSIYLCGRASHQLGNNTHSVFLKETTKKIQKLGENLFLIGSVPLYGLFYALPKKAIQLTPQLIDTLVKKTNRLVHHVIKHIILPFWNQIIKPTFKVIRDFRQVIAHQSAKVARWIFNHVISPFYSKLIKPILTRTYSLVVSLINALKQSAIWVGKNIVKPLWERVIYPFLNSVCNSLIYLGTKTKQVAVAIFQQVIKPLWNQVVCPILNSVCDSLVYLGTKTKQVALVIFKNIIKPLWNQFIRPILNVIIPISRQGFAKLGNIFFNVMNKIISVAQLFFERVLIPVGLVIKEVGQMTFNSFVNLTNQLMVNSSRVWQKISSLFN